MLSDDDVVERMRLRYFMVAAGEIPFGGEGEAILDLTRTDKGDG